MNKLFTGLTIISTCLISSISYANPSLGNSAIKQHNEAVQNKASSAVSTKQNSIKKAAETEGNRNTWGTAFDKHEKRVESEPSLQNTRNSSAAATKRDHGNNESLSNSAIKKHENIVNEK